MNNIRKNLHVGVDLVHRFLLLLTEQTYSRHWVSLPVGPVTAHNTTALKSHKCMWHDVYAGNSNKATLRKPIEKEAPGKDALTRLHPPAAPGHPQTAPPPKFSPAPAHITKIPSIYTSAKPGLNAL